MCTEARHGTTTVRQLYISSYQAEDEEQAEFQKTAMSLTLRQSIAVTQADLVNWGMWNINIECLTENHFRQLSSYKPFRNDNSSDIAVLIEEMLKAQASQIQKHGPLLAVLTETKRAISGPKA